MIMRVPSIRLLAIGCLVAALPSRTLAQGAVTGMVIDAGTERPLANALVSLWNVGHGRLAGHVLSDSGGRYHVGGLGVGEYTLAVRSIGYRPTHLTVILDSIAVSRVSVALAVHPVRLQSIRVARPVAAGFGDALSPGASPLAAEREYAGMTLDPGSRVLTARDLRDAVTFAERDPMRALQRLPGVAGRDDYSSAMWTRGASFDKTTVTFDGLPLFNALHATGLTSTINPDIVGALEFHPGVQPARSVGAGAATATFQSRRADAFERTRGAAELSFLTGRLSLERASRDGRHGLLVAARRSHVDRSSALMEAVVGARAAVPFVFSDAAFRADVGLSPRLALEVAGIRAADRLWGDVPGVVERTTAAWGGGATRAALVQRAGDLEIRYTLGASEFSATAASHDTLLAGKLSGYQVGECGCVRFATEFTGQPLSNRMGYRVGGLGLRRLDEDGRPVAEGGVELTSYSASVKTTGSWPHGQEPGSTLSLTSARTMAVVWGERMIQRGRTEVVLGLRAEHDVHDPILLAPRVSARYRLTEAASVTAGVSRGYQHAQALTPTGSGRSTIATADMFWVVSGELAHSLRADLLTGGWHWAPAGAGAELSLVGYLRYSQGVLVPDPTPGPAARRELFVAARGAARGAELSARKDLGASTVMASVARSRSTLTARDREYAAPWERETVIRGGTSIALLKGARWMSQYTWESGAPYTRYFTGYPSCRRWQACTWSFPPSVGEPSAHRLAPQQSLDSGIEWVFSARAKYGVFVQGFNLVRSRADATYLETEGSCLNLPAVNTPCDPANGRWETATDATLRGMARTWSAGLRVVY